MVQTVESRIHKLLLEHKDTLKVADILLKDWDTGSLSWVEQNSVGHFLLACGYVRAYFDQVSKNLKIGQKIPWSSFIEALSISRISLTKEDFDQIFVGAGEEQSLKDLVKCRKFDGIDGRFKKIRNSMDHTVMRAEVTPPPRPVPKDAHTVAVREPKQKLNQNLNPKQGPLQISEQLPSVESPKFDPEITATFITRFAAKKEDEVKLRIEAKKVFEESLEQYPGAESEAAIALGMMGAWSEGLEILQRSLPSFQRHLLELDFLLQADRGIELLELAEKLYVYSPNLTQKSYIQFMQAQALLKLKRPNEAYTMLENVVAEDPEHLAARALLDHLRESSR